MNQVTTNDRITFTVIGLGLTGAEWITRLEAGGHVVSNCSPDILTKYDYDKNHRLEAGKEYKVTLVLGKEIRKNSERTTSNLKEFARREIGDQSVEGLKGELVLLIREKFSNAELEAMGVYFITVLHEPIVDSAGDARVLESSHDDDGSDVNASCADPDARWGVDGAFAFFSSN